MELLRNLLLVLHFVGLAALLGLFIGQLATRPKTVPLGQLHGALTMLVTGVALVGVHQAAKADLGAVDNGKITTKLVVLLVITGLVIWGRRTETVKTRVWALIGLLGLANVVIAVFW